MRVTRDLGFLLAKVIDKNNSGLCRDDGLILLRNVNRQNMDRIRKNVIKIFKEVEFKIEIRTNLKIVDFLDVTFNLTNVTFNLLAGHIVFMITYILYPSCFCEI